MTVNVRVVAVIAELEEQRRIASTRCTGLAADLAEARAETEELKAQIASKDEALLALRELEKVATVDVDKGEKNGSAAAL